MVIILLKRTLGLAYEAGRILDGVVTAGTLDNAYAAVLEGQARRRAHAALKTEEDRELAHPA